MQLSVISWFRQPSRLAAGALGQARRYCAILLGVTLLGAAAIAGVNAAIDPLSYFTHANRLNRIQPVVDERAQKTNWLAARPDQFNAVLLGSSRSTYIDQRDFVPWRMFNYAVNAMWPGEYRPYLDHVAAINGRSPDLVVLGMDFFGSRRGIVGQWRSPEYYLSQVGDAGVVTSSMLSIHLLGRSLHTAALSLGLIGSAEKMDYYDRNNIRHFKLVINSDYRAHEVLHDLEAFQKAVYGNYTYNGELRRLWTDLRAAYPNTHFLVFTTPISEPMFALLVQQGRLDDYGRWLADLTGTFGQVWDFMGLNSVTTDLSRYRDAQHFDPGIGRLVVDRLLGRPLPAGHEDFGRRVTPESLPSHLAFIRAQSACLDQDPVGTARAWVERIAKADGAAKPPTSNWRMEPAGSCRTAAVEGQTS